MERPSSEGGAMAVTLLCAGMGHSMAVKGDALLTWGWDLSGRWNPRPELPRRVAGIPGQDIVKISAGARHSMALTSSGALLTWGDGSHGRLGHGDVQNQPEPKLVAALQGKHILAISAGESHSMALTREGLYTWGKGEFGRLGHGDSEDQLTPRLVTGLPAERVSAISAGGHHSMALATEGVYTWGGGAGRSDTRGVGK
eukprot:RCo040952